MRRLGAGGEGTVFEARDPHGGGLVALKQLHPSAAASANSLTREFRALADIVHPNLVALHELFCVDEQWFYSMERVRGTDIVHGLARSLAVDADASIVRTSFAQLLRGISAIHAADKLHRDLKPSNVMLNSDGRVVVLDYGTVINRPHEVMHPSDIVGTPAYAAPEQIRGQPVPASDLYAVGVILFETLTGQLPFLGLPAGMMAQKQHQDPLPPRAITSDVAPDLDALCHALLARDPADRPTLEQALAQLAPEQPARRAPAIRAPETFFIGRERDLAALLALSMPADGPTVALVHGESGVGKSALLARACQQLRAQGARVVESRCHEREHTPFKVFGGMVAQLARHAEQVAGDALNARERGALARLFPELRGRAQVAPLGDVGDAADARAQAFSALRALLAALAATGPIVLAVDDLQWGDLDSMRLLAHVLTGPDAPRLAFLGVYRESERGSSPFLRAALTDGALSRLAGVRLVDRALSPLDAADARSFLRASAPHRALSDSALDAQVAHARGLPFALQQLAEQPALALAAGVPELGVEALVQQRVAERSPHARQLLELLCVAGRPLETTLALCASDTGSEGWRAARELCSSKLARWLETGSELCIEPYHDLIRAALVQQVPVGRVRGLHAAIVATMDDLGMDAPEHALEHLVGAGEHERAGHAALAAAERASEQLAWNRAASLLLRARALLPAGAVPVDTLSERLGYALAAAERHRDSADAYREAAAATTDPGARQRLHALAAQQLMRGGATTEGVALFEDLLRGIGLSLPRSEPHAGLIYLLGRARAWLARSLGADASPNGRGPRSEESEARLNVLAAVQTELWVPQPLHSCVVHNWLYREARGHHDARWAFALTAEVAHLAVKHGWRGAARCERLLARLDAMASEVEDPRTRALACYARSLYLMHCQGRPPAALPVLDEADALFAQLPGSSFERGWLAMAREAAFELAGRYHDLLASVAERERKGIGGSYAARLLLSGVPVARLIEDRPDDGLAFLEAHWPGQGAQPLLDVLAVSRQKDCLLYRGDHAAAHALIVALLKAAPTRGPLSSHLITAHLKWDLANAAVALYHRTRDPALRRQAMRAMRGAYGQDFSRCMGHMISASFAYADGAHGLSRALLVEARDTLMRVDAYAAAAATRARIAQLDGAERDLEREYAWFRERGVRRPERWVTMFVAGPEHW